MKFLIDENLSPKIASFLNSLGYSATAVRDESLRGKSDQEIAQWARENNAVIITRDLDFGYLYKQIGSTGILILRGKDDSSKVSIRILNNLHQRGILTQTTLLKQLTVATETRIRYFKRVSS